MEKNEKMFYKKIVPKITLNKKNINNEKKEPIRIRLMNINRGIDHNLKKFKNDSYEKNKENIIENDEEDDLDFFNFLKFDLKRKINHEDISWDKKEFNIWNPSFSNSENEEDKNNKNKI